ncbi:glycosyltransferase family 2 protein [bacterium]|nr:glycosyltransferase family 2 protein [bacterium]NBX83719.1 glycosyltransferase family 2 protein [bacterium]
MKKLIIQIPSWNEEKQLPFTLSSLPKQLAGIDRVEWLVIDDGSSDATAEAARKSGAHHVIQMNEHSGLAKAFKAGVVFSIRSKADILVNTDADNQYDAGCIPQLIEPILRGRADMVVGDRKTSKLQFLPFWKRLLYFFAGKTLSLLTGQYIPDPTSGFRAFSAELLEELEVSDSFSYVIETLIQTLKKGKRIEFVPIESRIVNRPSRLIRFLPIYILRTTWSVIRAEIKYSRWNSNVTAYPLHKRSKK